MGSKQANLDWGSAANHDDHGVQSKFVEGFGAVADSIRATIEYKATSVAEGREYVSGKGEADRILSHSLDTAPTTTRLQGFGVEAGSAPREVVGARHPVDLLSFSTWREYVRQNLPWLEVRNRRAQAFAAAVTFYRVGGNVFTTLCAGAFDGTRRRHLREEPLGYIKVIWQLSGQTDLEQEGRALSLQVGHVVVLDTSRPFRMSFPDRASVAILLLPYEAVPEWSQVGRNVCGILIDQSGTTHAALAALMSLNSLPAEALPVEGAPVLTAVRWMLSNTLRGDRTVREGEAPCGALMAKLKRFIVEHVGDPTLGPDQLASALCVSRSTLYLLFRGQRLSPLKMIQDIRLNQARLSLEDLKQANRKMTCIALDVGFPGYATFSRLFKAHFGITPSDFRAQRRLALCA